MSNDSEKRVRLAIQAQGPSRPAAPVLTDEGQALCEVIADLRRDLDALRRRVFRLESGGDCA